MLKILFKKSAILLLIYQAFVECKDLLHLFRPKPDLPQELNDFLTDVQQHKKDFAFIRNVAKNRRKYKESLAENHQLFAEDMENEDDSMAPNFYKRSNDLEHHDVPTNGIYPYMYDNQDNPNYGAFDRNSFIYNYPEERYSKYIHSPVRLRRELDTNYMDTHVQLDHKSRYGEIKRPGNKLPGRLSLTNQEYDYIRNRRRSAEDHRYYPDEKAVNKRKREVEISIKSDGKLIKRIEEDENGPKSIVLNIKANNPTKSPAVVESTLVSDGTTAIGSMVGQDNKNNIDVKVPGNSIKPISENHDQNVNSRNYGVPINAVQTNVGVSNKNPVVNAVNNINNQNSNVQSEKQNVKTDKFNLPEITKVSTNNEPKVESSLYQSKPSSGFNKPIQNVFSDSRSNGNINQMSKPIDVAENNINNFDNTKFNKKPYLESDLEEPKKESEFDRVQGLVVDSSGTSENVKENKANFENPIYSNKIKRMEEGGLLGEGDLNDAGSVNNVIPFDYQSLEDNCKSTQFEYIMPLEQEATAMSIPYQNFNFQPNQKYEIVEHSTRNIIIVPITETATVATEEAIISIHVPKGNSSIEDKEEKAQIIGEAIAEELVHSTENTAETVCGEVGPNKKEEIQEINILNNDKDEVHGEHGTREGSGQVAHIEIVHNEEKHEGPHGDHHEHIEHQEHFDNENIRQQGRDNHVRERDTKKKKGKKKVKTIVIDGRKKPYRKNKYTRFGLDSHNYEVLFDDGLRNRKHSNLPKYKRKRVRQHPKKRIDREEPLADYYVFGDYDGSKPDENFDFIPSFEKRQLMSIESMYDAYIGDFGDDNNAKLSENKVFRKKMKSEGDYSDEEDSATSKPVMKKLQHKKILNEFGFEPQVTTEENDDDYNYSEQKGNPQVDEENPYENQKEEVFYQVIDPYEIAEKKSVNRFPHHYMKEFNQPDLKIEASESTTSRKHTMSFLDEALPDVKDDDMASVARGRGGSKKKKKKQAKPKKGNTKKPKVSESFEKKPMSDQEKEDLFLRFNPDFQRWPRFVQNDKKYQDLIKKRSLENRRYFGDGHSFPISNDYFVRPRRNRENNYFVKRAEPTDASAAPAPGGSEAASPAASEAGGTEGQPVATSVEGQTDVSPAEAPKDESGASQDQANPTPGQEQAISEQVDTSPNSPTMNDATLPPAAKRILETASGDLFENTTVPLMSEVSNTSLNPPQAGNQEGTPYYFSTNQDDLTEDTECTPPKETQVTVCEDDSASHSPVTVTSVLPLLPESATELKVNMSKDEYLDLNEILAGSLPRRVVSESMSGAKGNVRKGLNKGKLNMNLKLSNNNSSAETNMILNEMTNLMMRLKYHTSCQQLPTHLRSYLKTVTKNTQDDVMGKLKDMEEIDFDEHQSNYMFRTGTSDGLQTKADVLKDLLNKYNNLPPNCKERAEPVKEYIQSHLAMVENMSGNKTSISKPVAHPKTKKEISSMDIDYDKNRNMDKQSEESGVENQISNVNQLAEYNKEFQSKIEDETGTERVQKREINTSTSPQYGKLADAVKKIRHKRESERRIGEIYGRAKREDESSDEESKKEKGFEAPLVLNF